MKKIILALIIIISLAILFLISIILTLRPAKQQHPSPSTSPAPTQTERINFAPTGSSQVDEAESDDYSLDPAQAEQARKDSLVANLINLVPYEGNLFTLDYDFDNAIFVLSLEKNNEQEGNKAFEEFLAKQGVQRAWITNLKALIK